MKKVIKSKKIISGIGTLLASAGVFILAAKMMGFAVDNQRIKEITSDIDGKLSDIRQTESYEEYRQEQYSKYYEEYKAGKLSSDEFNSRVNELDSNNHILSMIEYVTDKQTASDVRNLESERKEIKDNITFSDGLTMGGLILSGAGCITHLLNETKKLEEEQEM